jgi:hypothetical protein
MQLYDRAWWYTSVIPATQEAETGSRDHGSGPAQANLAQDPI